MKIENRTS